MLPTFLFTLSYMFLMLPESKTKTPHIKNLKQLVEHLEGKGFENIRVDLPDHDRPTAYAGVTSELSFRPDATARKYDQPVICEISERTNMESELVTKWKLLAQIAKGKNATFRIFMPRGTIKFTEELIDRHQIPAELARM